MFPNTAPARSALPTAVPVSSWSVALYRKAEPIPSSSSSSSYPYESSQTQISQQTYGSFYIQLQHQAGPSSPSRSDVLHLRYLPQQPRNDIDSYSLPFTICQLEDMQLSSDTPSFSATGPTSRFYNAEQQSVRK
jgi:hypothetical protein